MHHHHIQSPLSSKVYVNLILIKKWGQHPREYEYLKVKLIMQKWIKKKIPEIMYCFCYGWYDIFSQKKEKHLIIFECKFKF